MVLTLRVFMSTLSESETTEMFTERQNGWNNPSTPLALLRRRADVMLLHHSRKRLVTIKRLTCSPLDTPKGLRRGYFLLGCIATKVNERFLFSRNSLLREYKRDHSLGEYLFYPLYLLRRRSYRRRLGKRRQEHRRSGNRFQVHAKRLAHRRMRCLGNVGR